MRVAYLVAGAVLSLIGAAGIYTIWYAVAHCPPLDICTAPPVPLSAATVLLAFGMVLVLLAFVLDATPAAPAAPPPSPGLVQSFRCHRCGILNAVGSQFCVRCGAAFQPPP